MEKRKIYAIVAATIQVPLYANTYRVGKRSVLQPVGRQIAQACHVVSKVRHRMSIGRSVREVFQQPAIIVLQARDSAELVHVYHLLVCKGLSPVHFDDSNPEYGPGEHETAVGVICLPKKTFGTIDYLPLWGSK